RRKPVNCNFHAKQNSREGVLTGVNTTIWGNCGLVAAGGSFYHAAKGVWVVGENLLDVLLVSRKADRFVRLYHSIFWGVIVPNRLEARIKFRRIFEVIVIVVTSFGVASASSISVGVITAPITGFAVRTVFCSLCISRLVGGFLGCIRRHFRRQFLVVLKPRSLRLLRCLLLEFLFRWSAAHKHEQRSHEQQNRKNLHSAPFV